MESKICKQCHLRRDVVAFRNRGTYIACGELTARKDSICKKCRDQNEKLLMQERPYLKKAQDTIRRHARKREMTPKQFLAEFDLTYEYIEKMFTEAAQSDRCPYCEFSYKEGKHGDMTLDVTNRELLPTRSNLKIIDEFCNNAKGVKAPDVFDRECKDLWRGNTQTELDLPHKTPKTEPTKPYQSEFSSLV